MARVSVIIPTYNSERWIRQAVESVLRQTFVDFEVVIVDDGSSDRTLDVLAGISDPRIRVFPYPNAGVKGPAASRNRGLRQTEGEFVAFLDHDDLWLRDKLTAQVRALEDHPEAAVAYSWVDIVDEKGQFTGPADRTTANGNVLEELVRGCFLWTASNPLIRRFALERVGPFDEQVGSADDWDMWLRLAEHYPFVCVPQADVQWRWSSRSISSDAGLLYESALCARERAFARNPDLSGSQQTLALVRLHEGVMAHSARGNPTRANSRVTMRAFVGAVRVRPAFVFEFWCRPWLLRAVGKAVVVLALPEGVAGVVFDLARRARVRWHDWQSSH